MGQATGISSNLRESDPAFPVQTRKEGTRVEGRGGRSNSQKKKGCSCLAPFRPNTMREAFFPPMEKGGPANEESSGAQGETQFLYSDQKHKGGGKKTVGGTGPTKGRQEGSTEEATPFQGFCGKWTRGGEATWGRQGRTVFARKN